MDNGTIYQTKEVLEMSPFVGGVSRALFWPGDAREISKSPKWRITANDTFHL